MDVRTAAFLGCAAMAWAAVVYKAAALRHDPRNVRLWALVAVIALPSAGFTLAITAVYAAITRWTGVPNLATLLVYCCIVGYSVSVLVMLSLWETPTSAALPRTKRLAVLYGCVLVAMVALFFGSNARDDHPTDFDTVYGPQPVGGTFLLVYLTAYGIGLGTQARQGWRFARRVAITGTRPWLRRGLRWMTAGAVIALGYCFGKAAFVITAWSGMRLPLLSDMGLLCACLGAVLITIGFTMPSWGPRLSAGTAWTGRATTYLRLYPLWLLLYRTVPDIAMDPPPSRWADMLGLRDLDFRLTRRLIEIADGQLALTRFASTPPPAVIDEITATHRLPADAVRHALILREAARQYRKSETSDEQPFPAASAPRIDTPDDLARLVQVATALKRLPAAPTPTPAP
ncbi:hypothetical protein QLQ12_11830 [Actinoplanes sp. NEAU-A12]|uniref:DUF6545 domain-containing protein n=1 Tax=Actinoplanes sandaracinus TaxID=3045177 RepID=A0ABT6WHR9_9ACTN|nr:MAB_1171c family putative transporter [Actinoplanes sandaracinus]MDI6099282.1 hypothetical protein [Actinoplanes sandaracinus]